MNLAQKNLSSKYILLILLLGILAFKFLITYNSAHKKFAHDYYVSNSGSNNNSGMSEKSPWQTVSKVNSTAFVSGDVIHFKSGDVWREQLRPTSGKDNRYITYTSYGTGAKPLLLGSVNCSNPENWEYEGKDIWKLQTSKLSGINHDVGNIIFDLGKEIGVKVFKENELKKQNYFWYDKINDTVKIYSLKNPAQLSRSIECAITKNIIDETDKSFVKFDGLALKYGGAHAIGGGDTNHIWISNCDINYIGGGQQYNTVRYGNGIEFWNNAHDNLVEKCQIGEIYDAAVTNQGRGIGIRQFNITYKNNIISNAEYSFEYWNDSNDGQTNNIVFENNSCSNAGFGWGHYQRPDPSGRHICFSDSNIAQTGLILIKNNTFINAKQTCFYISKKWRGIDTLVIKNNKYS